LHDGTTTGVTGAFGHVAFEFSGDEKFQAGQFFAQVGQRHQEFGRFRSARAKCQLRRCVGFKDEHAAELKPRHRVAVNPSPQRWWQMRECRNNSRPRARLSANWLDAVSRKTGLPQYTCATELRHAALRPGCRSIPAAKFRQFKELRAATRVAFNIPLNLTLSI
jgi:hypothetical protein